MFEPYNVILFLIPNIVIIAVRELVLYCRNYPKETMKTKVKNISAWIALFWIAIGILYYISLYGERQIGSFFLIASVFCLTEKNSCLALTGSAICFFIGIYGVFYGFLWGS